MDVHLPGFLTNRLRHIPVVGDSVEERGYRYTVIEADARSVTKVRVVSSGEVEVVVASFQERRDLHERYAMDAVPCLVVAGPDGAVHAGFLGPVTATDLWAAVAEAREPGSVREPAGGCARHADDSE